jgi:hypothetical protein
VFHISTGLTEKQEYGKNKKNLLPVATDKTSLSATLIYVYLNSMAFEILSEIGIYVSVVIYYILLYSIACAKLFGSTADRTSTCQDVEKARTVIKYAECVDTSAHSEVSSFM